jgi:hypothetical protein
MMAHERAPRAAYRPNGGCQGTHRHRGCAPAVKPCETDTGRAN